MQISSLTSAQRRLWRQIGDGVAVLTLFDGIDNEKDYLFAVYNGGKISRYSVSHKTLTELVSYGLLFVCMRRQWVENQLPAVQTVYTKRGQLDMFAINEYLDMLPDHLKYGLT